MNLFRLDFIIRIVFTVFQIVILFEFVNGQSNTFLAHYGGASWDYAKVIKKDSLNSGYYIAGTVRSGGVYNILLLKIDLYGNLIFEKSYGVSGNISESVDLCIKGNNCIYIAGCKGTPRDGVLLKTAMDGTLIWNRAFIGTSDFHDYAKSVAVTSDGSIFTASIISNSGNDNLLITKHNDNGTLAFSRLFLLNTGHIRPMKVIQTNDGSYLITGYNSGISPGGFILKISNTGNVIWLKNILDSEDIFGVEQTSTGEYVFSGNGTYQDQQGGVSKLFIFKTDTSGQIIWNHGYYYINYSGDLHGSSMRLTPDQSIVIGGTNYFDANNYEAFILKTSSTGNLLWAKSYGGDANEYVSCIENSIGDGGFILTGDTYSNSFGINDVLILKTDSMGYNTCKVINNINLNTFDSISIANNTLSVATGYTINPITYNSLDLFLNYSHYCFNSIESEQSIQYANIYPTYIHNFVTIETKKIFESIEINDIMGNLIYVEKNQKNSSTIIDFSRYSPSLYLIQINYMDKTNEVFKVIKSE